MLHVNLLGIDTAKNSFVLYGIDKNGKQALKKQLSRDKFASFMQQLPPCTVVMEACGGSHHWGRTLRGFGHEVKLIAPQKAAAFRKINKNDANDAVAIVRSAMCHGIEFVVVKELWQQDIQSLHRIRARHTKNQTSVVNEMRGLLAEYGIAIAEGIYYVRTTVPVILQDHDNQLTPMIRGAIADLHHELLNITESLNRLDKQLEDIAKTNDSCQRLNAIPGIGVISATAVIAACADPSLFKNGRQFAAWLGLTPGHRQTGGKDSKPIMLGITKKGDPYIRSLLVQGGMSLVASVARRAKKPQLEEKVAVESSPDPIIKPRGGVAPHKRRYDPKVKLRGKKALSESREAWIKRLLDEKGYQKAAVACANRNARIIWALLKNGAAFNGTITPDDRRIA